MKKVMAMCAALTLAVTGLVPVGASADGDAAFVGTVSSEVCKVGDTITLTVSTENNPGVHAWKVDVAYDDAIFEIIPQEEYESDFKGDVGGPPVDVENVSPAQFTWSRANVKSPTTTNGTMFEVSFKIKETAEAGVYTIDLSYDPKDVFVNGETDGEYDSVEFKTVSPKVTVDMPIEGFEILPEKIDFAKKGETKQLETKVTPEKALGNKKITYKSSNEKVATVDDKGLVTAVDEGTATITASVEDGKFTDACSVTVPHMHTIKKVEAKVSTCTEQGNIEYFTCEGCGKLFSDADGKNEIKEADVKLPLAAHSFTKKDTSEKYLKSAANCQSPAVYYYSCEVCGEKGTETFEYGEPDKTNHVGETEVKDAKEATCTEEGYTGDTYCKECGELIKKGEVIPTTPHKLSRKVEAVEPDCQHEGNIAYWVCEDCGKLFSDEEGKNEVTLEQTVLPKTDHKYGEDYKFDDKEHWKECVTVGCGTIVDKAEHSGGTASCTEKAKCEICGAEYGELDPDNHIHTEIRDIKDPTCEEEGYTGDRYCMDCGKLLEKGEAIPAKGHSLVKVEAKEATEDEEGNIEYYKCEVCGKLFSDADGKNEISAEDVVIGKKTPEPTPTPTPTPDTDPTPVPTVISTGGNSRVLRRVGIPNYEFRPQEWPTDESSSNSGNTATTTTTTVPGGGSAIAATGGETNPQTGTAPVYAALGAAVLGLAVVVTKKRK